MTNYGVTYAESIHFLSLLLLVPSQSGGHNEFYSLNMEYTFVPCIVQDAMDSMVEIWQKKSPFTVRGRQKYVVNAVLGEVKEDPYARAGRFS